MNPTSQSKTKGTSPKLPVKAPSSLSERRENEFSITIGKSPADIFAFWRNFSNLTKFMKDIKSVENLSANRSKWTVELKNGLTTEWIATVNDEVPGELISWATTEGEVKTEGTVRFDPAPAQLGTVVSLSLDYVIPGGKLTELVTTLSAENPEQLIQTNLKRLKGFLETGEIATTEGQPSGREEIPSRETKHTH